MKKNEARWPLFFQGCLHCLLGGIYLKINIFEELCILQSFPLVSGGLWALWEWEV